MCPSLVNMEMSVKFRLTLTRPVWEIKSPSVLCAQLVSTVVIFQNSLCRWPVGALPLMHSEGKSRGLLVICRGMLRVSLLAGQEKQVSCPHTPLPSWCAGVLENPGAEAEHLTLPSADRPHQCPCPGPGGPSPWPAPLGSPGSQARGLRDLTSSAISLLGPGKRLWVQNKTCEWFPDRQSLQSNELLIVGKDQCAGRCAAAQTVFESW